MISNRMVAWVSIRWKGGWWDGRRVGFVGWGGGRECWVVGVVGWWLDGWLGSAIMPTYICICIRNHREPSMHIYDDYE